MPLKQTLKNIAQQLKAELYFYRALYTHPQTPRFAKVLLYLAIAYVLLPFDVIPDFLPIIGQLDELVIVPLLLYCALRLIPETIKQACRLDANTKSNE